MLNSHADRLPWGEPLTRGAHGAYQAVRGTDTTNGAATRRKTISVLSVHSWCPLALLGCVTVMMPNSACAQPGESDHGRSTSAEGLSPTALVAAAHGQRLYIAYASAGQVAVFDVKQGKVIKTIAVPASPVGLALSSDGTRLYVTCGPCSTVCVIDTIKGIVLEKIRTGYHTMAPVLSPDGKTLYVCNRLNGNISVINVATLQEQRRIPVAREPVAAAITKDGHFLLVANYLSNNRADEDYVAATISVIDLAAAKVSGEIALPNGSTLLRGIQVSPDGQYACVTHSVDRFHLPATQLDRGWLVTNAMSVIDVPKMKLVNTVLLDEVDRGAANPWAVAWSADGRNICVTHAGTHEISVIDRMALFAKLSKVTVEPSPKQEMEPNSVSRPAADVCSDLSFLVGLRHRTKLGDEKGPRAIALLGNTIYTANYFSDSLSELNLDSAKPVARTIRLGERTPLGAVRKGEMLFNDASICFQGWLSCASCHSADARVDGTNLGFTQRRRWQPKKPKSLLKAFEVAPTTWLGARENASTSIRADSVLFCSPAGRSRMPRQSARISVRCNRCPVPIWRTAHSPRRRDVARRFSMTTV